jgi:hypothetical protein
MSPLVMGILIFVAKQIGSYGIKKILEKLEGDLSKQLSDEDSIQDLVSKFDKYFRSNPGAEERVRRGLGSAIPAVIEESREGFKQDDLLLLFQIILGEVITVMREQKRDLVISGFFTSPDTVTYFGKQPTTRTLEGVEIEGKKVVLKPDSPDIYVFREGEFPFDAEKVNSSIMALKASEEDYVGFYQYDVGLNMTLGTKKGNKVWRIYPNYVRFEFNVVDVGKGKKVKILDVLDIAKLPPEYQEFHRIESPRLFEGIRAMIASLRRLSEDAFLSEEVVSEIRQIIEEISKS